MKVGACISLFVSLVYCAESTVRWFVVREKYCWMAADSADKSKRTGLFLFQDFLFVFYSLVFLSAFVKFVWTKNLSSPSDLIIVHHSISIHLGFATNK
jgi:hypothetical protein